MSSESRVLSIQSCIDYGTLLKCFVYQSKIIMFLPVLVFCCCGCGGGGGGLLGGLFVFWQSWENFWVLWGIPVVGYRFCVWGTTKQGESLSSDLMTIALRYWLAYFHCLCCTLLLQSLLIRQPLIGATTMQCWDGSDKVHLMLNCLCNNYWCSGSFILGTPGYGQLV